jgi:hypothetical protein
MTELPRDGSTLAFDSQSRKISILKRSHPALVCPPQKPSSASAAEKGGPGFSPDYVNPTRTNTKKANPSAAARPGAAEKGGSGVSHD